MTGHRWRGLLLLLAVLAATVRPAAAQPSFGPINGAFTPHIGAAIGQEGKGVTTSIGASVSVLEETGWGAELDAAFANEDGGRSGGLNVQTYVVNVLGMWPRGRIRPFVTAGGGALRARTCVAGCVDTVAWTDWVLSAGGGVRYQLDEFWALRGDLRYFTTVGDHGEPARADGLHFWRAAVGVSLVWFIQ